MPLVQVKLYDHELTEQVVSDLITNITDAVCASMREQVRPAVWVLVEGMPPAAWGSGGAPGTKPE